MNELLPTLRESLRETAERGHRRRRPVVPLLVAIAAVAVAVPVVAGRDSTRSGDEIPAVPTVALTADPGLAFGGWTGADGDYTIVIVSSRTLSGAERAAQAAQNRGLTVGILDSDDYASLNAGYQVVFSGRYSSKADAEADLDALKTDYPEAYVRQIHIG